MSAGLAPRRLNPGKLLLSKWTAAIPANREKHFLVSGLIPPEGPGGAIDSIEMDAVHSGRRFILRWRELNDTNRWLQGWL